MLADLQRRLGTQQQLDANILRQVRENYQPNRQIADNINKELLRRRTTGQRQTIQDIQNRARIARRERDENMQPINPGAPQV